MGDGRNCLSFEVAVGGIETPSPRLSVRRLMSSVEREVVNRDPRRATRKYHVRKMKSTRKEIKTKARQKYTQSNR